MYSPENQTKNYSQLFSDIDTGLIKIPQFQRDFVWEKEQTAKLIDSIIKGYPIGTFIFWKTDEELKTIREIGNLKLPERPKGDKAFYVLDGQQRITSLYAVRKGCRITREGKEIDYKDIYIDLNKSYGDDEEVVGTESDKATRKISVFELLDSSVDKLQANYADKINEIWRYKEKLSSYNFPVITLNDYPLDIACEVFTRINTGGKPLNLFEIMVARTFDEQRNFDLAEKVDLLLEGKDSEEGLRGVKYETISPMIVLQSIAAHLSGKIKRSDILKIKRNDFIDAWEVVKKGIFQAVDFLRSDLQVRTSHLLPYDAILVAFSYFFIRNEYKRPSAKQRKMLEQYLFWVALSNRFTSGAETKIETDLRKMDKILNEEKPDYRNEDEIKLTVEQIEGKNFKTSDAFSKAILCLLAQFEPKSFETGNRVDIENAALRRINSKNYHHFFPKDFLRKQGWDEFSANSVVNITIIEGQKNVSIGKKAPSRYILEIKKKNRNLDEILKTHLIDDVETYGIYEDDYEKFLRKRGRKILTELNKRLPKLEKPQV